MNAPLTPFVLLAAGARDLPYPELVGPRIGELAMTLGGRPLVVRHGACPGPRSADQAVADWITQCGQWLGVTADPHPADWDHCAPHCPPGHRKTKLRGDVAHPGELPDYCPSAGPRRNAGMVNRGADLMYAWPHGRSYGTRGCMKLARRAGIQVIEVTS